MRDSSISPERVGGGNITVDSADDVQTVTVDFLKPPIFADTNLAVVREFHETFNHPITDIRQVPINEEIAKLRISLIFEELEELAVALGTKTHEHFKQLATNAKNIKTTKSTTDEVEVFDALCDLQYVLSGAVLALGYSYIFEEGVREVHNSNMSKVCKTREEADATIKSYRKQGIEVYGVDYSDINGTRIIIYRTADDKVLKSIGYQAPNLAGILEGYKNGEVTNEVTA